MLLEYLQPSAHRRQKAQMLLDVICPGDEEEVRRSMRDWSTENLETSRCRRKLPDGPPNLERLPFSLLHAKPGFLWG